MTKPWDKPFAPLIQHFFTKSLTEQKSVSPNTIQSYRDAFCLFLRFVEKQLHVSPQDLRMSQVDVKLVTAFLNDLEVSRCVSPQSRNLRLTALRSFFRFVTFIEPACAESIRQVLDIPAKRFPRTLVPFLSRIEIDALLSTPNRTTWIGRRDYALMLVAVQTGLRLSELTSLELDSVSLESGAHIRCTGKGRRERCVPLTRDAVSVLREWCKENRLEGGDALFPTVHGSRLSSDAVQRLVQMNAQIASRECPSLKAKRVSPHVLRHTAAMELLSAGVDTSVIALYLGHKSPDTTHIYLEAYLPLMEAALAKIQTAKQKKIVRFRPPDDIMRYLKAL